MFYDEVLGRMSRAGAKMVKVVAEKRKKTYFRKTRNIETGEVEDVVIGKGWEVVRELKTSEEGEKIWKAIHPEAKEEQEDVV